MEQSDIDNAVNGIMEMRPTAIPADAKTNQTLSHRREVARRLSEIEFEREISRILEGEMPEHSAFFFKSHQPYKGKSKNGAFNSFNSNNS
ncbi:hypothetical protein [Vibrio porteresiae]|uniref:Uncharacterized protein n=1 Tax=Vibrio porteresiae DSM 19223 TaxID=1123496 RepID=A0ABZ0QBN3_9VIBR|nr:hypothetical protein [Vibrio porteresiae]WPC72963.1 hypothetical protein R8Z52_12595 [Vibrio porteresiae DSM 19223]